MLHNMEVGLEVMWRPLVRIQDCYLLDDTPFSWDCALTALCFGQIGANYGYHYNKIGPYNKIAHRLKME